MSDPVVSPAFSITVESSYTGVVNSVADILGMPQADDGIVWARVNNSRMTNAEKSEQDWLDEGGTANDYAKYQPDKGFPGTMIAWTGGVHDSQYGTYGRYIMGPCGGHQAYGGNEVCTFNWDTVTWDRILDPTGVEARQEYAEYLDYGPEGTPGNNPCSRHTYFWLTYDPVRNLLVCPSGNTWFTQQVVDPAGQNGSFFYYPLDSITGDSLADKQYWVRRYPSEVLNYTEGFSFWHPRGAMIYIAANKAPRYMVDPTADEWTPLTGSTSKDNRSAPAYFSALDAVWAAGRHDKGTNPKLTVKRWDMSDWDGGGTAAWSYEDLTGDELRVHGADSGGSTTMVPFPSTFEDTQYSRYVYWRPYYEDVSYGSEDPGLSAKIASTNEFWLIGQDKVSRKVGTSSQSLISLRSVIKNQDGAKYSSEHFDGGGYTRMGFNPALNVVYWFQSANSNVYVGKLPTPLYDGGP